MRGSGLGGLVNWMESVRIGLIGPIGPIVSDY